MRYVISSGEIEDKSREYLFSFHQPMMPPASLLLFFTSLCGLAVSAREVNLHHRLFVPSVSQSGTPSILPPWVPRGTAEILSSHFAKYSPVSNLNEDLVAYRYGADTHPMALYQVALELPGVPPNLWPFSSVKTVCITHIPHSCGSMVLGEPSHYLTLRVLPSATSPTRLSTR